MCSNGYDPDARADVYIVTQGGTFGAPRVLWQMSVADAMAVCSDPSTIGQGRGGEWMLNWTCHRVTDTDGTAPEVAARFHVDDGRFDALFERLGVRVLASRAMALAGQHVVDESRDAQGSQPPALGKTSAARQMEFPI